MTKIKCAVNENHSVPFIDVIWKTIEKPKNFHIVCEQKHILYYEIDPQTPSRITAKIEMNKVEDLRLEQIQTKIPLKYWEDLTLFENSYIMEFQHGMSSAMRSLCEGFVNDCLLNHGDASKGFVRSVGVGKILKCVKEGWSTLELTNDNYTNFYKIKETIVKVDLNNKLNIDVWKSIYECYNLASDCLHGAATSSLKLYTMFKRFVDIVLQFGPSTYEWTDSEGGE